MIVRSIKMSTTAKRFDGNVSSLTRHLFLDSIIVALTSFIIGLPTISTIYNYLGSVLGSFPRVRCYPPSSINTTTEDIEYFCLSYYSLYTTTYPATATVHGILILSVFYIWINHHSSMFDLFYSWAKKMDENNDPKKNLPFLKKIKVVIAKNNRMFAYYVAIKVLQAIFACIAFILTLILIAVSPFHQSSSISYDLIFDCQVDQFELLNLTSHDKVPCTVLNLHITIAVLYINLVLLFSIFLLSVLSIFPKCCLPRNSHKLFEDEDEAAVLFSFHTGLSPYFYQSKESPVHRGKIRKNLEFLKIFLFRTNSELANKVWDVEMYDKIKEHINEELMMTISNYKKFIVNNCNDKNESLKLPDDLNIKSFKTVLKTTKEGKLYSDSKYLKLKLREKPKFREAVLGYCSAASGRKSNAVYIAFDPNSFGIPLALSFIFENVYIVCFDPDFKVEDVRFSKQVYTVSSCDPDFKVEVNTTETLWRERKYNVNFIQLIFPHDILASEPRNWPMIAEGFKAATSKETEVDCFVCGPVKDEPSHIRNLTKTLSAINKASGCILLTVTADPNMNKYITEKYITEERLTNYGVHDNLIPKWKSLQVRTTNDGQKYWSWGNSPAEGPLPPGGIEEENITFTFKLYQYSTN